MRSHWVYLDRDVEVKSWDAYKRERMKQQVRAICELRMIRESRPCVVCTMTSYFLGVCVYQDVWAKKKSPILPKLHKKSFREIIKKSQHTNITRNFQIYTDIVYYIYQKYCISVKNINF